VSTALADEVRANARLEILGEAVPITFDADLGLVPLG
jgi:hypothetical protein